MVAELDITDQDVTSIADMIDGEIASLVPEWSSGPGIVETPRFANQTVCHNCVSNHTSSGSFMDFLSTNPVANSSQLLQCCRHGCSSLHGRFEEITYEADDSDHHGMVGVPNIPGQSNFPHGQEDWVQHESRELSSVGSGQSHSDEDCEKLDQEIPNKEELKSEMKRLSASVNAMLNISSSHTTSATPPLYPRPPVNHENEMQQELRWLRAKYQTELRELRDQQLGILSRCSSFTDHTDFSSSVPKSLQEDDRGAFLRSLASDHHVSNCHDLVNNSCPSSGTRRARNCEAMESPSADDTVTPKSFNTGLLLPPSIRRSMSLPVDAVDV